MYRERRRGHREVTNNYVNVPGTWISGSNPTRINLANSSTTTKETMFLRESLVKQITPPEPLTPLKCLMSRRGMTRIASVSATKRIFDEPRVSYMRLYDDQKDPLSFQQLIRMPVPYLQPKWDHHFGASIWGAQPRGEESRMTAMRFLKTAHFLACCASITKSLEHLSSTICDRVRSSSRKILLLREEIETKPSFIKGHIKKAKAIPREHGPNIHGVRI